jgi:unsaturated rhamnogalacturonyl hydrolase
MKTCVISVVAAVYLSLFAAEAFPQPEFSVDSIKSITKRCAHYRLKRGLNKLTDTYGTNQYTWDIGAYMTGIMALYRTTREQWVLDSATKWSNTGNWGPGPGINTTFGDDQCCEQTFCEIYLLNKLPADLTRMTKASFDNMKQMFDVNRSTGRARWWWSDALYMAPPAISRIYTCYKTVPQDSNNAKRLLDSMDVYWKDCAAYLYSTQYKLWFRDGNWIYPKQQTANGSPVFWSGCNAWAIAGLARVLQDMPATYRSRAYYEQQFRDVCNAIRIAPALGTDGLWRTSLLDYNQFPDKESIATAFFGFAFAWGVNNGLLNKTTYEPVIRKTWSALVATIGSDGRLQWCQGVSDRPQNITQSFSAAEGEGAFMLFGEELIKMLNAVSTLKSEKLSGQKAVAHTVSLKCQFKKTGGRDGTLMGNAAYDLRGKRVTGTVARNGNETSAAGIQVLKRHQ